MKDFLGKCALPFAAFLTGLLQFFAYPNANVAEFAYLFAIPLLLIGIWEKSVKRFAFWAFFANWVSWIAILIWLRHVTLFGTICLAGLVSVFPVVWFVLARYVFLNSRSDRWIVRCIKMIFLAVAWSGLEWTREWIFSGFPWGALSITQWQRPVVLQAASFGGGYLLSSMLILFNLGITSFLWKIIFARREVSEEARLRPARIFQTGQYGSMTPELYLGALPILATFFYFTTVSMKESRDGFSFVAGVVQPYNPARLYFEDSLTEEQRREKFYEDAHADWNRVIENTSLLNGAVDVVLWPEAIPPMAVLNPLDKDAQMLHEVQRIVKNAEAPILMGAMAIEKSDDQDSEYVYRNAIIGCYPDGSIAEPFYSKRHLVPFGEYIPKFFRMLPLINKIVPIAGDFTPGNNPNIIPLKIEDKEILVGGLVCYEDVFPYLAWQSMRASHAPDLFFVATNNAWYGEESGAYQHAAHAVLRAVENRRPLVRCGNGGWSGWIDEWGKIRQVFSDDRNNVYVRGVTGFDIVVSDAWRGKFSFYTRFGHWYGALSGIFTGVWFAALFIGFLRRRGSIKS